MFSSSLCERTRNIVNSDVSQTLQVSWIWPQMRREEFQQFHLTHIVVIVIRKKKESHCLKSNFSYGDLWQWQLLARFEISLASWQEKISSSVSSTDDIFFMLNKLDSSIFLLFVSVEFSQIISNVVRHKTLCVRAIQLNFVQAMINDSETNSQKRRQVTCARLWKSDSLRRRLGKWIKMFIIDKQDEEERTRQSCTLPRRFHSHSTAALFSFLMFFFAPRRQRDEETMRNISFDFPTPSTREVISLLKKHSTSIWASWRRGFLCALWLNDDFQQEYS